MYYIFRSDSSSVTASPTSFTPSLTRCLYGSSFLKGHLHSFYISRTLSSHLTTKTSFTSSGHTVLDSLTSPLSILYSGLPIFLQTSTSGNIVETEIKTDRPSVTYHSPSSYYTRPNTQVSEWERRYISCLTSRVSTFVPLTNPPMPILDSLSTVINPGHRQHINPSSSI